MLFVLPYLQYKIVLKQFYKEPRPESPSEQANSGKEKLPD